MEHFAVIDIGTVSVRLAVAACHGATAEVVLRISHVCNLGEGVDATGRLSEAAQARVCACVEGYLARARVAGAQSCCCTLTSAARDASNADELLGRLAGLGVAAEIIDGALEGELTFAGVASDFAGERILVADNGGGSTEFAYGAALQASWVRSTDLGCRRLTERFLVSDPPRAAELARAQALCVEELAPVKAYLAGVERAARLVVCGGTATSLVAISKQLEPYGASQVHLANLDRATTKQLFSQLAALPVEQRREVVGLQPRRAPLIVAGALIISTMLDDLGFECFTVSEHDLLCGLVQVVAQVRAGRRSADMWVPQIAELS